MLQRWGSMMRDFTIYLVSFLSSSALTDNDIFGDSLVEQVGGSQDIEGYCFFRKMS